MLKRKNRKRAKYKAVIIGAGRIGAQFDSPKNKEILTHAHAYFKNAKINLAGLFDINKRTAKKEARKWHCRAFSDFNKMFMEIRPDIVSICTPDADHLKTLLKVAKYRPKLVICEKPITVSPSETEKVIKLYKKIGVPILVNYSRRFDKTVWDVKREIEKKESGRVLCASGIYTKGILHNGSHLIDLARFLFGEVKRSEVFYAINDYDKKDKSVAGFLEFEKCKQFHLMVGDERKFSIFELDVILGKKRFHFIDSGFYLFSQEIKSDPLYKGYKALSKPTIAKTALSNSLPILVNNALDNLEKGIPLICDMYEAFRTQITCFSLRKGNLK